MVKVREVILVEGRYDKNTLRQVVDAPILETKGFGIFKNKQMQMYLRDAAQARGVIVLTDSDGAGFVIRNFLKGILPKEQVKQAYIPDIYGKERRKAAPGKEGKLGVEGLPLPVLREALLRAGAHIAGEEQESPSGKEGPVTKGDFYDLALSGAPDSGERRRALQKKLGLPERLSANGLLQAVNALYGREEFTRLARKTLAAGEKEDAEDGAD